ncbi:MAG: hypothetical protein JWM98_1825 [Thermoleophilia bacterium]|nr:hypothetical protein [Thermoleophilia bacterium]
MDLALALLLLWGLLFTPLGIVLHWLVLGEGARLRALPIAPVTGVAIAVVVLGALGRLDIDAGDEWVKWSFVGAAIVCTLVIWRCRVAWRSRELIGAGLLLVLAALLVQLPVVGVDGEGPLGYGTASSPVTEVAAIDAAAHGPAAKLAVARRARAEADDRPIGFEQFAALTVAIGLDDHPGTNAKAAAWTAYGLHAAITGMLAALVALPLFGFARARGVRWFGLVVLVPLGVLAPAGFLALANGSGAAVASVPFTTSAVFSLLVTRRDRGWWALVVLFGAAISTSAGPLALLPLVAIGLAWMFVRSDTYEHLSQHDTPVSSLRTLVVTTIAAALGVLASVTLLGTGELLAWSPLHTHLLDAARSWPFGWLDTDLSATGPDGPLETAIWLVGPALVAVAVIYAIVRNERRELGVLVGAVGAAVISIGIGLVDRRAGIRLLEFTFLSTSPFLAALAIRAVSLARAHGDDPRAKKAGAAGRRARWAGAGPSLLVVAFVVLSFSATSVTGTRMVHAPSVDIAHAASTNDTALIAAGDPWLEFVVDGERVRGGYADADAVSEASNGLARRRARTEGYDRLVLSSSPLSSDPSLRYRESSDLDTYQVRLFKDQAHEPVERDSVVDGAFALQRGRSLAADRPGAEQDDASTSKTADPAVDATAPGANAAAANATDATAADATATDATAADPAAAAADQAVADATDAIPSPLAVLVASRHDPVEGTSPTTPPDRPAGRLLPATDVPGCSPGPSDIADTGTCEPAAPVRGPGCTKADIAAVRSPLDRNRPKGAPAADTARKQVLDLEPDDRLPRRPTLVGVQCFDVELDTDSSVLLVHLRDVGLIFPPTGATAVGKRHAWHTEHDAGRSGDDTGVGGGARRVTSELGASLEYGDGRLDEAYDLTLEGDFGAGVEVATSLQRQVGLADDADRLPPTAIRTVRGSADGFSEIIRGTTLSGVLTATNDAGTDVRLGRLFARPRDLPPSCDVPIALATGEQREIRTSIRDLAGGAPVIRPGLSVSVVGVRGSGGSRTARVAVGTYLTKDGLPRYTLVDWTEQFEEELQVDGCDGLTYTETGATPSGGVPQATDVTGMLGAAADKVVR